MLQHPNVSLNKGPKRFKLLRPRYLIKKAANFKIEHEDLICYETHFVLTNHINLTQSRTLNRTDESCHWKGHSLHHVISANISSHSDNVYVTRTMIFDRNQRD